MATMGKDGKLYQVHGFTTKDIGNAPAMGVFKFTAPPALVRRNILMKMRGTAHITQMDSSAGSPIELYLCQNKHSEAELVEAFSGTETLGSPYQFPLEQSHTPEVEWAARKFWYLGYFTENGAKKSTIEFEVKPRWVWEEESGWSFFYRNAENTALTGANWGSIDITYEAHGKWL